MNLFFLHRVSLGNVAASRGWLGRLERLVEAHDLEPLRGWAVLLRAVRPGRGRPGRRRGPRAPVARGRPPGRRHRPGALRPGPGRRPGGRGRPGRGGLRTARRGDGRRARRARAGAWTRILITSCTMIACCSRAAQVRRAAQWIRAGDDFVRRYGSPHVFTVCRLHSGNVLLATGRWAEAEAQLEDAIQGSRRAEPALFAEALAKLAELRLAQGRVEEAAGLLAGFEDRPTSVRAMAGVHLARGEPARAAALLRRRLRAVGDSTLESAPLVELLAEAEGAMGARRTAGSRARRLSEAGAAAGCEVMAAFAERTMGRTVATAGAGRRGPPPGVGARRLLPPRDAARGGPLPPPSGPGPGRARARRGDRRGAVGPRRLRCAGGRPRRRRGGGLPRSLGARAGRAVRRARPRRCSPPRARRARPARSRTVQPGHRRAPLPHAQDRRAPRQKRPGEAGPPATAPRPPPTRCGTWSAIPPRSRGSARCAGGGGAIVARAAPAPITGGRHAGRLRATIQREMFAAVERAT